MSAQRSIVIIGAGPIGLEAAAAALQHGHSVTILERGEVAEHLRDWGHVHLFTPFALNAGPAGLTQLRNARRDIPDDTEFLSGTSFRDRYLVPLAESMTSVRIVTGASVLAVGRRSLSKGEHIGGAARAQDGFRVLYEQTGAEHEVAADVVLDCAGTYGNPNWVGQGGNPALGERSNRAQISYGLPDVLGGARARFAGKRTLLIGSGHSAATSALALGALVRAAPGTEFMWVTRSGNGHAIEPVAGDTLEQRAALTSRANALAAGMPPGSAWTNGLQVAEIRNGGDGGGRRFTVTLCGADAALRTEGFDEIIANVGYEPDDSHYRQLQIHECYASRGPMKLAAALLAASGGGGAADCLALGGFGPQALVNPEPNYFILGAKSYGKNSAFLMRSGYEQIGDVLTLLQDDPQPRP